MNAIRFVEWAGDGVALFDTKSSPDGPFDIAVTRTIYGYQRAVWPFVWADAS